MLVFPGGNGRWQIREELRSHIVVEFDARFCNHCLRLRPIMDRLSMKFTMKDQISFNRFDLDQNDSDFLAFDKVPLVMFYPKAVKADGVELTVFDSRNRPLPVKVIYKQIRKLMLEYEKRARKVKKDESGVKTDL
jgi:thiol-disulfide isomerase/thioredoxin